MIVQRRDRREGETDTPVTRVGYTASKKVGNAVLRNRAKRRMREAAHRILGKADDTADFGNSDFVLIARSGTTVQRPFDALCDDLAYALRKLDKPR